MDLSTYLYNLPGLRCISAVYICVEESGNILTIYRVAIQPPQSRRQHRTALLLTLLDRYTSSAASLSRLIAAVSAWPLSLSPKQAVTGSQTRAHDRSAELQPFCLMQVARINKHTAHRQVTDGKRYTLIVQIGRQHSAIPSPVCLAVVSNVTA